MSEGAARYDGRCIYALRWPLVGQKISESMTMGQQYGVAAGDDAPPVEEFAARQYGPVSFRTVAYTSYLGIAVSLNSGGRS